MRKTRKAYATLINNRRCSRAGCWKRGSLWEQDGDWLLECPRNTQEHFKDDAADERPTSQADKEILGSAQQLRPNWGKMPMAGAPSSSSGAKSMPPTPADWATEVAASAPPTAQPDSIDGTAVKSRRMDINGQRP